jgi:hypothetical protein
LAHICKIFINLLKVIVMTENITMGDILQMDGTHRTSKSGSAIATVIGIVGAIIVIALIWKAFVGNRDNSITKETNVNKELGADTEAIRFLTAEVNALKGFERQDAIKLAYNDGAIYGHGGHGHGGHNNCGHGGHDGGCVKQNFREVKNFVPATTDPDTIQVTSICG